MEIERLHAEVAKYRAARLGLLDRECRLRRVALPVEGEPLPIIFGIDVEPDRRVVDLADPTWQGAAECFEFVARLRARTLDTLGVPLCVTWFPRADPQVEKANGSAGWALEQFAEQWAGCKAAGDEVGLHMHPWKWVDGQWSQDHGNDDWVVHCLKTSLAAYRQVFGETPASYRGGDRYLSNAVAETLEHEGVKFDLTLERMPGVARLVEAENGTGEIPDGMNIPSHAYTRSDADFRVEDPHRREGLKMLPLTAYRAGTLIPWLSNLEFDEEIGQLFEPRDHQLTHLAFVARSDVVLSVHREDFAENVLSLARRVAEGRAIFATPTDAWTKIAKSRTLPGEAAI